MLSACSPRSQQNRKSLDNKESYALQEELIDRVVQQEAMLVNVPIPLYDQRILSVSSHILDDTIALGYLSPLNAGQAIDFFMNQMERHGWKHLVSFQGVESFLQFKNPEYYCTVVIKKLLDQSSSICIYMKRASSEARS